MDRELILSIRLQDSLARGVVLCHQFAEFAHRTTVALARRFLADMEGSGNLRVFHFIQRHQANNSPLFRIQFLETAMVDLVEFLAMKVL
jgi:hypothetical protein